MTDAPGVQPATGTDAVAEQPERVAEQAAKIAALRATMSEGHAFFSEAKKAAANLVQGGCGREREGGVIPTQAQAVCVDSRTPLQ